MLTQNSGVGIYILTMIWMQMAHRSHLRNPIRLPLVCPPFRTLTPLLAAQGWLHGRAGYTITQKLHLKEPVLDWMLCCHHHEILKIFQTGSCAVMLHWAPKLCSQFWVDNIWYTHTSSRGFSILQLPSWGENRERTMLNQVQDHIPASFTRRKNKLHSYLSHWYFDYVTPVCKGFWDESTSGHWNHSTCVCTQGQALACWRAP